MIGYIYNLYGKTKADIFYVGSTVNPKSRLRQHRTNFPFYIFDCRINLSIIEEVEFTIHKDLVKQEMYWIQQFTAWGFELRNYCLGYGKDTRWIKKMIEIENDDYS